MSVQALRLTPDGRLRRVALEPGGDGDHLDAMYREIGRDLVECVGLRRDLDVWIDEESKLKDGWDVNVAATTLLQQHGIQDLVVGTALLTGGANEDGNTLGITDQTAADIERLVGGGG